MREIILVLGLSPMDLTMLDQSIPLKPWADILPVWLLYMVNNVYVLI